MKKDILKLFFTITLILALFACTKDFKEMNTSPNSLTKVPYKTLITNAENSILTTYYNPILSEVVSWSRYNCRDVYVHGDRYAGLGEGDKFWVL